VQRHQLRLDRPRQPGRRLHPSPVQRLRLGRAAPRAARAPAPPAPPGESPRSPARPAPCASPRASGRQLVDLTAVLAPQPLELVRPLLRQLELTWLEGQLTGEPRRRRRRLLAGHLRRRQLLLDLRQQRRAAAPRRASSSSAASRPAIASSASYSASWAWRANAAQRCPSRSNVTRAAAPPARPAAGPAARSPRSESAGSRPAPPPRPRAAAGRPRPPAPPATLIPARVALRVRLEPRECVEQLEVPRHVRQRVVLVLTADVDQLLADRSSTPCVVRIDCTTERPRPARPTTRSSTSPSSALALPPPARQQRRDPPLRRRVELELRLHPRRLGPLSHQLRAPPGPPQQRQRVDDDRLARPRLAGEHVHPAPQLERHIVEQGQATDVQVTEHGPRVAQPRAGVHAAARVIRTRASARPIRRARSPRSPRLARAPGRRVHAPADTARPAGPPPADQARRAVKHDPRPGTPRLQRRRPARRLPASPPARLDALADRR
jgi:hypothetical protein